MKEEQLMNEEAITLLDVVALLVDVPHSGLTRGQVGTVVEWLATDVYEVEFSTDTGHTYASVALPAQQLLVLHYAPVAMEAR